MHVKAVFQNSYKYNYPLVIHHETLLASQLHLKVIVVIFSRIIIETRSKNNKGYTTDCIIEMIVV